MSKNFLLSTLIAAATIGFATVPAEADIYLNFNSDYDDDDGRMDGNWNNFASANNDGSTLIEFETGTSGTASAMWTSAGTWDTYGILYPTDNVLYGYLDDGGDGASVTISNISYLLYDVVVLASTDNDDVAFTAKTINGITYTSDADGNAIIGDSSWGTSLNSTITLGTNALKLSSVSGGTLTVLGGANTGDRGGIAGIQIIDQTDKVWKREIASDTTWAGTAWTNAKTSDTSNWSDISSENNLLTVISGTGTMQLDQAITVTGLGITSGNVSLSNGGNSANTLTYSTISVEEGATLNIGVKLVASGTGDVVFANNGTINVTVAQDFGSAGVILSGGETTFADLTTTGTLSLFGGTNTFNGALSAGNISISGGTNIFNTSTSVSIGALSGSTNRAIGGTSQISIERVDIKGGETTFFGQHITVNTGTDAETSDFHQQGGIVNIGDGTTATSVFATSYVGVSDGYADGGEFNIKENGVFTVTGSSSNADAGYQHSFQIAHWGSTQTFNVDGVLNLSNVGLSTKDGTGALNVGSTGTINFNAGLSFISAEYDGYFGGSATLTLNGGTLNIGSNGISNGAADEGLTLNLNSGTIGSLADSWSSSRAMTLGGVIVIDTTKKTYTEGANAVATGIGSSVTLSGVLSGAGSLTKSGAGTLTISAANTYTGGTTISAGTLIAGNASAFGTGAVSVASGAKLQIASDVTLSGVSGVTLADGAKLVVDLSGKTSETEKFVIELISSTAISVAGTTLVAGDVTSAMSDRYELLGWNKTGWTESWSYADNTLSLTLTAAIPEPSLFGVLAGLGALALVGTRRRRRK